MAKQSVKLDKCPNCSGPWKTVTEKDRTYDACVSCGYVNSDSIKPTKKDE